jgi:hypothetical protein
MSQEHAKNVQVERFLPLKYKNNTKSLLENLNQTLRLRDTILTY